MATKSIIKIGVGITLFATLICLFTGFASAQVVYENYGHRWVNTYNGPGNRADQINAILPGLWEAGCYSAGFCARDATYSDLLVLYLNDSGDTNWVRRYRPPNNRNSEAKAMAYDDWTYETIYVTGTYDSTATIKNMLVLKINALTGDTLKTLRWNYPTYHGNDVGLDIIFFNNRLYIAGYSDRAANNRDFIVWKLDTLLNVIGTPFRLNGSGNSNDEARSINAKWPNAIYVGGYVTNSGTGKDFAVVKLDTNLVEQWHDYIDGSAHSDDECHKLNKLDYYNYDPLAVGYLTNSGTMKDAAIARYAGTGRSWLTTYNGPGNADDEFRGVTWGVLASYIYAAGYATDTTGGGGKDLLVAGYGSDGALTASYRYNGPGNNVDEAFTIGWSDPGDWYAPIYVTGTSYRAGTGNDLIVTKHRQPWLGGALVPTWIYRYDGGGGANAHDAGLVINAENWYGSSIQVAGYMNYGGTTNTVNSVTIDLARNMPPSIPALISPVDSAWLNDTVVNFYWNSAVDDSGVTQYRLQRAPNPSFTNPESTTVADTFCTMSVLDTLWYWRIKARDTQNKWGDYSTAWKFNFDLTAPTVPILYNPVDDQFVLSTSVYFDWSTVTFKDVQTTVHYVIQIDTAESFVEPVVQDTFLVTDTTFTLAGSNRYYWRVKAYDLASNESPYATAESFRLDVTIPLIDSTTEYPDSTEAAGPFNVYTKVSDMFGVDSVRLYFKRMEDPVWFFYDMTAGGGWYFNTIPAVALERDTVKYYVWAKDNATLVAQDPPTGYYQFIANTPFGIQEYGNTPKTFDFGLKSNPAKGQAMFNLALPQEAVITLKLYDASGRLIDRLISGRKAAGYYQIPWSSKGAAGVYFYSLESPWRNEMGKLVLVR